MNQPPRKPEEKEMETEGTTPPKKHEEAKTNTLPIVKISSLLKE